MKMNLISFGIILEIFLLLMVFYWIRVLKNKQNRQPSLSKKIIKNLKFWKYTLNIDFEIKDLCGW